ncbi:uncharacterized protein B0H64DRAFT_419366 [Chaetomium fimeti]|uniref:DUF7924 domain-containing protein n=1 Tax=Chaetomium fimeti TaxID=1854472 RepID=A0AAE0HBV5_9PEZI|nr:hypothetical protein B0H64DRAFT_419366 [Chaetomium fimeti]
MTDNRRIIFKGLLKVSPATHHDDGDGDENKHQSKRARLTRKNLALFNTIPKKGSKGSAASAPPDSTAASSTRTTSSTTTSAFAIQAHKNGILNPAFSKSPKNLQSITKRLARSRETVSPTESVYKSYVDKVAGAPNQATMVFEVGRIALSQTFTGFPEDVGFDNGLPAPQPDFVEGLRMREFDPFPVDEHVSGSVAFEDNPFSVTLPHVAGEWKRDGKDIEEARLRSAYDGAALVYARNQALSHLGKPDPTGHVEVMTFATDGTNINFFTHYTAPSEDGKPEYHQHHVTSTNLTNSHQEYRQGYRQLRNAQDYAREGCWNLFILCPVV